MTTVDSLLQEMESEGATTRRVLDRVPNEHLGWRPHQKSMTLGQLAQHVATMPSAITDLAVQPVFQMRAFSQVEAAQASALVQTLDTSLAKARATLGAMTDASLGSVWRLMDGEREVLAMPRLALLRSIMLNHWYHHRGQLSVYLRLLDVPLPSIYGPTADENPFMSA